jgi:hypothetical protein
VNVEGTAIELSEIANAIERANASKSANASESVNVVWPKGGIASEISRVLKNEFQSSNDLASRPVEYE